MYNFKCPQCSSVVRKIASVEPKIECGRCQILMIRDPKPPGTQVREVLDNGLMPRRLERLRDAEELHRNRNKK